MCSQEWWSDSCSEWEELAYSHKNTNWIESMHGYIKLNKTTRNDQFSLPFIDKMLDRPAEKKYSCFLALILRLQSDYYKDCYNTKRSVEDKFTCSYGTVAFRKMPFGLYNARETFQKCMVSIFLKYN